MKKIILGLILGVVSTSLHAQKVLCSKQGHDRKDPDHAIDVPAKCPAKVEDCICYDQYFKFRNDSELWHNLAPLCIGKKYLTWYADAWDIDSARTTINGTDTLSKYSVSRKRSKLWYIPKKWVKGFDPAKWSLASQVERVIKGEDTIYNHRDTTIMTWYVLRQENNRISIDTLPLDGNKSLRFFTLAWDGSNPDRHDHAKQLRSFFFTGYLGHEYIKKGKVEKWAKDYVLNWQTGELEGQEQKPQANGSNPKANTAGKK